jgi:hypothetical protein
VCDNQGVLRREARAAYDIQLGSHKEAEADLLLTMQDWAMRGPYRVHLRWVKGHQDEDTPVEKLSPLAKLNIEMDELAESVHESTFPFKTTEDQEVLPAEKWALFLGSEKVTTKLRDRVLHQCHYEDLVSYVAERHSLSEHDIEHISWSALHAYIRRQKMARRAVVVKYLHGWLLTKGFLHKQGREESGCCPVCNDGVETQTHLPRCPYPEAVRYRSGLLKTFSDALQKAKTAPEIRHCWVRQMSLELGLGEHPASEVVGTTLGMAAAVQEARRHQNIIGWDNFSKGLMSDRWKLAQDLHFRQHPELVSKHTRGWENICVRALLDLGLEIWKWRNETVHGKTVKEAAKMARAALEARVERVYADPPSLLRKFPAVRELALSTRLKQSSTWLLAWLRHLEQQIAITTAERVRDRARFGSIRRFLRKRDVFDA